MICNHCHTFKMATSSKQTMISTNYQPKNKGSKTELKYLDYSSVSGSIGNTPANWSTWYIPRVTRGVESYSRIGNQVTAKAVDLRFLLSRNSAGTTVQRMRWMVLYTREPYGTATVASDIFTNTGVFSSPRNPDYNVQDFRVLAEGTAILDSAVCNSIQVERVIPCNFVVKYGSNGGTVADCTSGNIELLMWSDQSSNQPTVSAGSFRFYFTD